MKKRTRLFCLLLALVLLVSLLPLNALADSTGTEETKPAKGTVTVKVVVGKTTLYTYKVEVGDEPVKLRDDKYIKHKEKYYEFSYYTVSGKKVDPNRVTIAAYDTENPDAWQKKWGETIKVIYKAHRHDYKFSYGRIYHWSICECGDTTNEVRHVDPAKDADKVCTCGYRFSDNADLTTLWLSGMVLSPKFSKETTDYTGQVHTYLDVTATDITANPFDALAKVDLPENLEIHEGANTFEITVTAEDKTTTKTYTVIAVKPVKVDNTFISASGTSVSAALKTTVKRQVATAVLSDAVTEKMLELAAADGSGTIALAPEFSKWSVKQAEIPLSPAFLKAIAEKTKADLVVTTPYGSTLTIPNAELTALAEGQEAITLRINRDNTFEFLTMGEPLTASREITLTTPETP